MPWGTWGNLFHVFSFDLPDLLDAIVANGINPGKQWPWFSVGTSTPRFTNMVQIASRAFFVLSIAVSSLAIPAAIFKRDVATVKADIAQISTQVTALDSTQYFQTQT